MNRQQATLVDPKQALRVKTAIRLGHERLDSINERWLDSMIRNGKKVEL